MQLIQINGPSCVGKSTVIKGVMEGRAGLYHLSYDSQKWKFSHYDREMHQEAVQEVVLAIAKTIFALGYPTLCDNSLYREQREKIATLAREHGYEVIDVNLEADYGILETRFKERLERAEANPNARVANKSLDRWKEPCAMFEQDKNPNAITYRTDQTSEEEIIQQILGLIK